MTNAPRSKERGAGMSNSSEKKKRYDIPLWCKPNLSIEEAAAYSGIGMGKLYEMTESQDCPFVLWIGSRRMIKRKVSDKQLKSNMPSVPIWKKMNLTVEEASEYSGIGTSKIKELSNSEDCPFVLWNGAKRLIKRKQFEEYLSSQYSL